MCPAVLVYIDGSFGHEVAARYGLVLAKALGGACHVCSGFDDEEDRGRKESSARRISIHANDLGVRFEVHLRGGSAFPVVRSFVDEIDPDVVMASLDHEDIMEGGIRRGSLTVRMMEQIKARVVLARVVNCGLAFSHRRVLLPIARPRLMSKENLDFVGLLLDLVRFYPACLDMFSCVEISPKKQYQAKELSDLRYSRRKDLNLLSEEIMKRGTRPEMKVTTCTDPAKEILDFVSKERYDLVIARAPRRNLLSVFRGPEVIERVLMGTPSNILLWKPAKE